MKKACKSHAPFCRRWHYQFDIFNFIALSLFFIRFVDCCHSFFLSAKVRLDFLVVSGWFPRHPLPIGPCRSQRWGGLCIFLHKKRPPSIFFVFRRSFWTETQLRAPRRQRTGGFVSGLFQPADLRLGTAVGVVANAGRRLDLLRQPGFPAIAHLFRHETAMQRFMSDPLKGILLQKKTFWMWIWRSVFWNRPNNSADDGPKCKAASRRTFGIGILLPNCCLLSSFKI